MRQELYGLLLAHYIVRWWMHQSACEANLDPDRLSFTHVVKRAYSPFHRKRPEQQGFTLKRQCFCDILLL